MTDTAGDADGEKPERDVVWMTTAMLKAYSHPLRRKMLNLLRRQTYLRAADFAAQLDVPANSASFHLRVLADAGLIEEAPEKARDRRDRVWTGTKGAFNVGGPENPVPDEELGTVLIHSLAEDHQDVLRRIIAWSPEYVSGRAKEPHGAFTQRVLRLTVAEFEKVLEGFDRVIDEVEKDHDPNDPDGRYWQIDLVAADDQI